jgi:hypothetical protein
MLNNTVRFVKERQRELENKVENLSRENGVMREGLISFEAKNREMISRLEMILRETKKEVSIMDFRIAFDKVDRNIEKTRVLLEIAALREHEIEHTMKKPLKNAIH